MNEKIRKKKIRYKRWSWGEIFQTLATWAANPATGRTQLRLPASWQPTQRVEQGRDICQVKTNHLSPVLEKSGHSSSWVPLVPPSEDVVGWHKLCPQCQETHESKTLDSKLCWWKFILIESMLRKSREVVFKREDMLGPGPRGLCT